MLNLRLVFLVAIAVLFAGRAAAQIHLVSDEVRRAALADEAHIERMVMVPMRDGVRLASRIYLPKDGDGPFPTILWRSPYNFSEKMVPNPSYSDANLKFALDAVRHGYAFMMQNERGKFFSEGEFEVLGRPRSDGHDTLSWIAEQNWSNGKVGTIGCSSTAEWIMGLASSRHPAHAAAVPMGQGAGIGRMGPHYEQGNFYKGGAIQLPMLTWLYNEQNTVRPMFPPTLSRDELIRVSKYYDLAPDYPQPDWHKAFAHLPLADALVAAGGPNGIFDQMVDRGPDHPDWYKGGLYHDDEDFTVPALWVNSWFDLSVEANTELFNHVRRSASEPSIRDSQYMIIAPTEHCHMYRLRDPHVAGDRSMGRVHFGLDEIVYEFFDYYMKNEDNGFPEENPRVRYFSMGRNQWRSASTWPPEGVEKMTLFLASGKGANTLRGDGRLTAAAPTSLGRDTFVYDPMNPVPTHGGNFCCLATAETPGSFDQRANEARQDVLVYSSEPLPRNLEVSGPIEVTLFVSSDARDTDFTVKLLDVEPDGTAWNLVESIQRARYRDGYDREVFMEPDGVYALKFAPLETSNEFKAGHRIRLEISSSNYPRFERNLNTGGQNARETNVVVATNAVHHGPGQASYIVLNAIER
ncbi:MAG: CocE/NonD family hydrolase [Pseudomonadota bacterium]